MLEVSGLKGTGVDELLERVFLESEVLELRSHPTGPATAWCSRPRSSRARARSPTCWSRTAACARGDVILAGEGYGKVRSIHDDHGKVIAEAGPSKPVEVTGLNELPFVGDKFYVVESLDRARRSRARWRARTATCSSSSAAASRSRARTCSRPCRPEEGRHQPDHQGRRAGLGRGAEGPARPFAHSEVDVKVLHAGVGEVLESDVDLASTSDATILAFHVNANARRARRWSALASRMRYYEVIYELLDDVRR
jgi:translation initiation factor IF-2